MADQDGNYGEAGEESGGGYYDENGTWIDAYAEAEDNGEHVEGYYEEAGNWVEVIESAEAALALEGGYYDEWGNWVEANEDVAGYDEGYYDEWDNWVEPGIAEEESAVEVVDGSGYYDEWGTWVDYASSYEAVRNEPDAAALPQASVPNTSAAIGAPVMPAVGGAGVAGLGGGGNGGASSGSVNVEGAFKLKQTAMFVACERRDDEAVLALMEAAYAEPGKKREAHLITNFRIRLEIIRDDLRQYRLCLEPKRVCFFS